MRGGADTGARRPPDPVGTPGLRTAGLVLGFLLASAATAVVFLTEDARVLRISVVAVAWACLLAAVAAGRRPARDTDDAAAPDTAALEAELRRAYDAELEREVAARQRYELELENEVRREAEQSMRRELDALRGELAGLREGLSGIAALRADLAEIGGLRADVGRLRAELTEQLTGEMRVERLVMRTQSVRAPAGREPLQPAPPVWGGELDAGWSAQVPAGTVAAPAVTREPEPPARPLPPVPVPVPAEPAASPGGWPAERGLLDPADTGPRRRHTDPLGASAPPPAEQLTVERPSVHSAAAGHAAPSWVAPSPVVEDDDTGAARLAQILAESGVRPGGRRHRYRD
ncbi:hypothetical protein LY71_11759 [Geodermatophilus tzadiensis]|uniref:DUF6779 domain-containing protein n=1 Tax=Geodermatophilus tzadiensis TaxID=1137988 RepID=A0A2T0TC05_9ACTN|nr:DUF6779 domain-containing protein [Geodermatophilus tzadiensis]PRY43200.1 hypothetical protein LY71_11759 [Geodermatophilus tzadiensis]